jgi:hypothetical protein
MIWWFLILGVSTLAVVCVAIALYLHLRRSLQNAHSPHDELTDVTHDRQSDSISH